MTEPGLAPVDRSAVQRLRGKVDRFARDLGADVETPRQIVEMVVNDMPSQFDDERLIGTRKHLQIATA